MKLDSWNRNKQTKIEKTIESFGGAQIKCQSIDLSPFILSFLKKYKVFFILDAWDLENVRGYFDIQKNDIGYFPLKPSNRSSGQYIDYDEQTYKININKASSCWEKIKIILCDKQAVEEPLFPKVQIEHKSFKTGQQLSRGFFIKTLKSLGYKDKEEALEIGAYVVRGGVVDVKPYNLDRIVRFSFLEESGSEIYYIDNHKIELLGPEKDLIVSRETKQSCMSLKDKKNKNDLFAVYEKGFIVVYNKTKKHFPEVKVYKDRFDAVFYKKNTHIKYIFDSNLSSFGVVLNKNLYLAPTWYQFNIQKKGKELFVHEMNIDDYFIHDKFGYCQFVGVDTCVDGEEKICLKFSDGLMKINTSSLSDLSFFGDKTTNKALSFLSKKGAWKRIKKRHFNAASEVAFSLFSSHEKRKKTKKTPFKKDCDLDKMFSSYFKYKETEDQLKAIKDVVGDLQKNFPTTRLLCGDVGFGKTEIALRAVFMCCYNNKKAAVVAPTKILSKQLYDEFIHRFSFFGYKITSSADLFVADKFDVLIGTHKVLNNSSALSLCSLLVVDEEHRFGVKQKEKIIEINPFSDVLYMSATPLPRSLQLAISKQRSITQINSPPFSKKQILTRLYYFNKNLVKEIILNETKRGGQVFFVDKSVYNVKVAFSFIQQLFPSLRIAFLHSKLKDNNIIKTMSLFRKQKIDVLISTTIIESGINVSSANTIIINNADYFGLSQLYQLRGRVGRGSVQAHAFLLVSKNNFSSAAPRLSSLMKNQSLGSGYNIAFDDLNIRGSGSVFGYKQSGASAVGFEYYSKLVALAIKNQTGKAEEPCRILLSPGAVPVLAAPSSSERLSIYSFVSSCSSVSTLDSYYKKLNTLISFKSSSFTALVSNRKLEILTLHTCISELFYNNSSLNIYINLFSAYYSESFVKSLSSFLKNNKIVYIFVKEKKSLKFQFKKSIEDCYILLLKFLKEKHV